MKVGKKKNCPRMNAEAVWRLCLHGVYEKQYFRWVQDAEAKEQEVKDQAEGQLLVLVRHGSAASPLHEPGSSTWSWTTTVLQMPQLPLTPAPEETCVITWCWVCHCRERSSDFCSSSNVSVAELLSGSGETAEPEISDRVTGSEFTFF